jgi:ribonuclease E
MTKRMLIDATHAEETRVVVLDGNRLEDFDVETSTKKQLKGNIYLAKVVRVEPSLQAAFVEYGAGRHGFLAFSEIHPDYYQIPVADRERVLALQAAEAREEAEREDDGDEGETAPAAIEAVAPAPAAEATELSPDSPEVPPEPPEVAPVPDEPAPPVAAAPESAPGDAPARPAQAAAIEREERFGAVTEEAETAFPPAATDIVVESLAETVALDDPEGPVPVGDPADGEAPEGDSPPADLRPPETIGGEGDGAEGAEEARARRAARFLRNYRIQEVIKRRQIMLVQVVKEERGTKGAALTTYISLAGRYCVLMPNSPRGGGISRKITSAADRRRLKEITAELDIPPGMGLIVRTAGANRPKPEIKRDCEYLMRLWDDIRELTLRSVAPALIYEEASLIKRAIRDVYSRDIDEVIVDGEEGWRSAHEFMRMLMPTHAKKVQLWRGNGQPLFAKHQVEAQLDAMLAPTVQLRSGGYLVINQTEALVAIDVNSGRSTRERGIEETALRTNLEAADEVARQLRLRDLAGLIVIDFIDMEARKHNAMVERRLKDALKVDRARIQVGHISHFGLMEMSRQRLRPSLAETSFTPCPHCGGTGHVRSIESSAIHVLRAIEEEGAKGRAGAIRVHVAGAVALYLLNHKRERLAEIETRYAMRVTFEPDPALVAPQIRIERLRPPLGEAERSAVLPVAPAAPPPPPDEAADDTAAESEDEEDTAEDSVDQETAPSAEPRAAAEDGERRRRRRRRRRGGRRETLADEGGGEAAEAEQAPGAAEAAATDALPRPAPIAADPAFAEQPDIDAAALDAPPPVRSRRRRGGRRRPAEESVAPAPAETPAPYVGPTPADPFGGVTYDIFDMMEDEPVAPPAPPPAPAAAAPATGEAPPTAPAANAAAPIVEPLIVEPLNDEPPFLAPPPAAAEPAEAAPAAPAASVAEEPAPEAPPAPVIQPIVIGAEEPPAAERKRGWWRR